MLLIPLILLNIRLQSLVQLLLVRQLGLQIRHLLHFALIDLNHGLVSFEVGDLLLGLFQLIGQPLNRIFILSGDQYFLSLELCDLFLPLLDLLLLIDLIRFNLLHHLLPILFPLVGDTLLQVFRRICHVPLPRPHRLVLLRQSLASLVEHAVPLPELPILLLDHNHLLL